MGFRVPDTLLISDYLHATWLCSQSDQEKKKITATLSALEILHQLIYH